MFKDLDEQFKKQFGCVCDEPLEPNHTASMKCRGALDIDGLLEFIHQAVTQALLEERTRLKELVAGIGIVDLPKEILREAKRLSPEQIFFAGQMNVLMRLKEVEGVL